MALTLTVDAQVKDRAEVLLQAAIKQELVEGDLKGAIEQFKKIAENSNPSGGTCARPPGGVLRQAGPSRGAGHLRARGARVSESEESRSGGAGLAEREWQPHDPARRTFSRAGLNRGRTTGVSRHRTVGYLPSATSRITQATLTVFDLKTGKQRRLTHDGKVSASSCFLFLHRTARKLPTGRVRPYA